MTKEAFIVDVVRTPRGKASKRGSLRELRAIDLVSQLLAALEGRNQGVAQEVEDVVLGCVTQLGDQGANIAKTAAVYAGWNNRTSGCTINRFCASGLSAAHIAAGQIAAGMADLIVAGGVETMSRVPMFSDKGAWFADADVAAKTGFIHMGVAADLLATRRGYSKKQLDLVAVRSHQRARAATDAGHFTSMIAVQAADGSIALDRDETIRDLTAEAASALEPAFAGVGGDDVALKAYPELPEIKHLHSIAASPGMVDAAGLLLIASADACARLGLTPRAKIRSWAERSAEPVQMITGNVESSKAALARAGLATRDIDRFEVNESFAAVPLHYEEELGLAEGKLNQCGGALAMGHPLGATGAILIATALEQLEREDKTVALASVCGGGGVAATTIIERI